MKKILGYKWKSNQIRKDNVDRILDIIGLGKDQDRMYCSLHTEIPTKKVVFFPNTPSYDKISKIGLLEELFEPVTID